MRFTELVDKIIEDFLRREKAERVIGKYYPSEIWGCMRRNWFFYKKPKEFGLDTLKIFQSGTLVHNFFRDVLFRSYVSDDLLKKFDYEGEMEYKGNGFSIIGRYDDFLVMEEEDKPILIEIKTVRDLRFFKEKVKPHHLMQIQFYLNVLNIEQGYIIYFDRGNLKHLIFQVVKDKKYLETMVKRAEKLHEFLVKNKVPPAEAKFSKDISFNCRYGCPYRKECLEAGD